jgi:hypothetical protein
MIRKFIIILLFCSLLGACDNPEKLKQTVLTKENLVAVQKDVNAGKGFTNDERQWYMLGQIQIGSTGGQVVGKTVAEVIAAGKAASAPKPEK